MRRALPFLFVVGSALLSYASLASAADPHNAEVASRLFREGVGLLNSGKPEEARVKLLEANALVRRTDIVWNLILAESSSKHYVDAVNHSHDLARDPNGAKENLQYIQEKVLPVAEPHVGLLEIDAPTGAQIEVDSKEKAGHAPLADPFAVEPGSHEVVGILGKDRLTQMIQVNAGQRVHVTLGNGAAVPPAPSSAAASVDINSMLAPREPASPPAPVGTPGADEVTDDGAGARKTRLHVTGSFVAGAVILGGIGTGYFVAAQGSNNTIAAAQALHPAGTCPNTGCPDLDSAISSERQQAITGVVFVSLAGASAVGALISWFALTPHDHSHRAGSLEILPTFAPGHFRLRPSKHLLTRVLVSHHA